MLPRARGRFWPICREYTVQVPILFCSLYIFSKIYGGSDPVDIERDSRGADQETEFLRTITFPEEDRARWTARAWSGGYRWFRSPNVIPIEQFRRDGK
jgi:hypothetical protein